MIPIGPAPITTTVSPGSIRQCSQALTVQLTGSAKAACTALTPAGTLTTWPLRTARAGTVT